MIGYIGLDCDRYTLREIEAMYFGKACREWDHTSVLQATLINMWRRKESPVVHPSQLHPLMRSKAIAGGQMTVTADVARAASKQLQARR